MKTKDKIVIKKWNELKKTEMFETSIIAITDDFLYSESPMCGVRKPIHLCSNIKEYCNGSEDFIIFDLCDGIEWNGHNYIKNLYINKHNILEIGHDFIRVRTTFSGNSYIKILNMSILKDIFDEMKGVIEG